MERVLQLPTGCRCLNLRRKRNRMNAKHRAWKAAVVCGAVVLAAVIGCVVWAWLDRLSWVRTVTHTVPPGWLRGLLLGW